MNPPHPLFDAGWYLRVHPEVADAGLDPLAHYLEFGDEAGYWPHPLFDPAYYGAQRPELPTRGGARLIDFVESRASAPSPHPLFDESFYLEARPDVAASGANPLLHYITSGDTAGCQPHPLFDPAYYGARHPELPDHGAARLIHFVECGGLEGSAPHPLFDAERYLAADPDIAAAGVNPLVHYLLEGDAEDRAPHPLFDPVLYGRQRPGIATWGGARLLDYLAAGDAAGVQPHLLFDATRYREVHLELAAGDANPLVHYLEQGDAAGSWPHPLFDPDYYGAQHPELPQRDGARLIHFVEIGGLDGSAPHPLFDAERYLARDTRIAAAGHNSLVHYLVQGDRENLSPHPLLDPVHYGSQRPDVPTSGGARLIDFLWSGGAQGHSPHLLFDARLYLDTHPEVAASGENPLVHYIETGDAAGYWPHLLFDPDYYGAQHPELPQRDGARLIHFVEIGGLDGSAPHPLFDAERYLARDPRIAAAGHNSLVHYLVQGDRENLSPHPLLDPVHYGSQRPDVPTSGGARLIDFLWSGGAQGHSPHLLFDARLYLDTHPEVAASGENPLVHYIETGDAAGYWPHLLFDPDYYGARNPEIGCEQGARLVHFLEEGGEGGRSPHPLFDAAFYLRTYAEPEASGGNPLVHYLSLGEALGYQPNPLFEPQTYRAASPDLPPSTCLLRHYALHGHREKRAVSGLFDAQWYRSQHPELAASGLDAIAYYRARGDAQDHWPNPLFDPEFYGAQHPEIPSEGGHRLLHYMTNHGGDDSDPHPLFSTRWYRAQAAHLGIDIGSRSPLEHYLEEGEAAGLRPTPLFDPAHYLSNNHDLRNLGQPLASHYHDWGCREGRIASPLFDEGFYISQHPELEHGDDNPLAHYIHEGEARGDAPHPLFDVAWYTARTPALGGEPTGALAHFLLSGSDPTTADPHPMFDSQRYREEYTLPKGTTPILHYLDCGADLGHEPNALFHRMYYLREYALNLPLRQTPLYHFVRHGLAERHRPGPLFDFCVQFFRQADPALRDPEHNPLARWLVGACAELSCPEAEIAVELPACSEPRVSVVIPAFGPAPLTLACLRALARAETKIPFEVIVVDDDPSGQAAELDDVPNLTLLRNDENLGFVRSCNRGAEQARGELLVLLNNDALVMDGWLDALADTFEEQPGTGIVGSRLLRPNGTLQEVGGIVYRDGSAANCGYGAEPDELPYTFSRPCDYVSGASLMIPTALFRTLSGFDEAYAPAFYEDTDLAFRVREAGLGVLVQPASRVVHLGGATCGRDPEVGVKRHQEKNRLRFLERWSSALEHQPAPDAGLAEACARHVRGRALVMDSTTLTPDQDSGSLRMFNLLRVLRRMGFAVSFAPADGSHREPYVSNLQRIGVQVVCPPHASSIERFLEEQGGDIDLCLLSRPSVGDEWLDRVKLLCPRAVVLYDTVDLHYLRRQRQLSVEGRSELRHSDVEAELRASQRADGVVVVSEYDREQLAQLDDALDIHVVSNIHELYPSSIPFEQRSGVLFIGGFRHAPNVDAVLWFVDEILPLAREQIPDLRFHVVGSEIPEEVRALASEHVVIEGFVPDVDPLLAHCLLSVAPLRYGSGVKGKVNQSMSHGLPCVATSVAAEGMEAHLGTELLVADDARGFADHVIALHRSRDLWQEVARRGLESLERTFSMEVAEEKLREILRHYGIFEGLAASTPPRAASALDETAPAPRATPNPKHRS